MRLERLPLQSYPTPFVGRESEITEILNLLADKSCRLLTLVGPGGIGKTRLALEAIATVRDQYFDGVYFVDLTTLSSPDALLPAIASAIGYTSQNSTNNVDHTHAIFDYLEDKQLLLVLDNFEHLLDGANDLSDLLRVAGDVQVLVTSREVLNLQIEWVRVIRGLPCPTTTESEDLQSSSAVQLFVSRALQYDGNFSLEAEKAHVLRICQLVEGMPLALELAATWLKSLSCADIVKEIETNIDLLSTRARDIPERHRSIRAIFHQTWQQLSPTERTLLARLSIFRGGFTQEAALDIADTTIHQIAILIDRSLIRRSESGRYSLHELLRQYAAEHLFQMPDLDEFHSKYSRFYFNLLIENEVQLVCRFASYLVPDSENIHQAWLWAAKHGDYETIHQAALAFHMLYVYRGFNPAVFAIYDRTLHYLKADPSNGEQDILYAYMLAYWSYHKIASFEDRSEVLNISLEILQKQGALLEWAIVSCYLPLRDPDHYYREHERWLQIFRDHNRPIYMLKTLTRLLAYSAGYARVDRIDTMQTWMEEAIQIAKDLGDERYAVQVFHELGRFSYHQGAYDQAWDYIQQSLAIYREMNDLMYSASCISWLGHISVKRGNFQAARQYYLDMLTIGQELNYSEITWNAYHDLGRLAYILEHYDEAEIQFTRISKLAESPSYKLVATTCMASVRAFTKPDEKILIQLSLVLNHPALLPMSREMAEVAREHLESVLSPPAYQAAWERGKTLDVETTLQDLINTVSDKMIEVAAPSDATFYNQQLPEPLTDRELEVIQLVASGYSNKELCEHLVLSMNTIRTHLKNVYSKLDADSRTRAVAIARELKLV